MSETEDKLARETAEAFFDKHVTPQHTGVYMDMPVSVFRPKVVELLSEFALELTEQRGVTSAKEFWEKNSKIAFEDADFDDIAEAYASSRLAEVTAQLEQALEFGYRQCEQGHNLQHALAEFKKLFKSLTLDK